MVSAVFHSPLSTGSSAVKAQESSPVTRPACGRAAGTNQYSRGSPSAHVLDWRRLAGGVAAAVWFGAAHRHLGGGVGLDGGQHSDAMGHFPTSGRRFFLTRSTAKVRTIKAWG